MTSLADMSAAGLRILDLAHRQRGGAAAAAGDGEAVLGEEGEPPGRRG